MALKSVKTFKLKTRKGKWLDLISQTYYASLKQRRYVGVRVLSFYETSSSRFEDEQDILRLYEANSELYGNDSNIPTFSSFVTRYPRVRLTERKDGQAAE